MREPVPPDDVLTLAIALVFVTFAFFCLGFYNREKVSNNQENSVSNGQEIKTYVPEFLLLVH